MKGFGSVSHSTGIDALYQYTGSGIQILSGSLFYIITSHLFSTTSVGAIALFVAIINLFNVIFQFGLSTASQHFTSYSIGLGDYASARHTIYKLIGYGFALSILGLISLTVAAPEIASIFLHSNSFTPLVRLLGLVLFGNIMFSILNGTLLGTQNFRLTALISIIIWISYYFGAILLAFYFRSLHTIIIGWTFGIFIGVIIEFIVVAMTIRNFKGTGKAISGSLIFSYSIPVLLSSIITYGASSADRFIVSGLLNLSSLGVYNFSLLIASSLSIFATPFNNILMPKFSEFYARGLNHTISNVARISSTLLSFVYVPAALGVAVLAPLILNLLGGNQYVGGSIALQIIMLFTAMMISQNIFAQVLAAVRMTRIFLYSSLVSLFSNIVLSSILIPSIGLMGAALGFSSVYISMFIILYYFASKIKIVVLDYTSLLKIWVASGVMYIIIFIVKSFIGEVIIALPFYIVLGASVYLTLVRLFNVFNREDKELVLSIFPDKLKRTKRVLNLFILH